MTARPVDAGVVAAFLEAASPLSVEISLRVLERIEKERLAQRHQWELPVEQARYEAWRASGGMGPTCRRSIR